MKKTIALTLLCVFLFNIGGYYAVFSILRSKASREMELAIKNGTTQNQEAIEIRVPFSLPYPIYQNEFDQPEGVVSSGDEYYHLVGQKIESDTLTMVLMHDAMASRFEKVLKEIDQQQAEGESNDGLPNNSMKVLSEFIGCSESLEHGNLSWSFKLETISIDSSILSACLTKNSPPPEA